MSLTWPKFARTIQARPRGAHRLTAREHQVLNELAWCANEDREEWYKRGIRPVAGAAAAAWPSTATLAKACGCSRDAINAALRGIEAHGILSTTRRPNRSSVYWFMEAWLSEPSDSQCPACADQRRLSDDRHNRLSEGSYDRLSEPSDDALSEPSDTEVEGKWEEELPEGNSRRGRAPDDGRHEVIHGVEITPDWILANGLPGYQRLVAQAANGGH